MDEVELFIDGKSVGVLSKSKPLRSGLLPDAHGEGRADGYEPDGPRQETVYPGQDSTVTIKILIRGAQTAVVASSKRASSFTRKASSRTTKAAEHMESAFRQDPPIARPRITWASLQRAVRSGKASSISRSHRDRSRLSEATRITRYALDTGNIDEAIRQLNTVLCGNESRDGARDAGAGLPVEGALSAIDRGGAQSVKLAPECEPYFGGGQLRLSDQYRAKRLMPLI